MTGEELKALRTRLGLTQKQLAEKIGGQQMQVSRWEKGKFRISKAYQRLIEQLIQ